MFNVLGTILGRPNANLASGMHINSLTSPSSHLQTRGYNNGLSANVAEAARPISVQASPNRDLLSLIVLQHSTATQLGTDSAEIEKLAKTMEGLLAPANNPLIEVWNKLPIPAGITSAIAYFNRSN